MNRKGMLANIIGTFVIILVGVSLMPVISQQIENAMNCQLYFYNNITNATYETPTGATDSFGGAGANYHFGGYDGQVKHKLFMSDLSPIKTNSSILNPDCQEFSAQEKTLLSWVPMIFAIGVVIVAIWTTWNSLRWWGVDEMI